MQTQTTDYLKHLDLNPAAGGPVLSPLDPRALFMFGFLSTSQEIVNTGTTPLHVSFDFAYDQGIPGAPAAPGVTVHAVLQPGQPLPRLQSHTRGHVLVWCDPSAPPQAMPASVRVHAWT